MDSVLQSWGQFNKAFTSVIYKCSFFLGYKTIAISENYIFRSFIELAPFAE